MVWFQRTAGEHPSGQFLEKIPENPVVSHMDTPFPDNLHRTVLLSSATLPLFLPISSRYHRSRGVAASSSSPFIVIIIIIIIFRA